MRAYLAITTAVVLVFGAIPCSAQDVDADGIPDEIEARLGTDPNLAETFTTILDDGPEAEQARAKETYDPSKDILTVEFCNVAGDRMLWRVTFAATPTPENSVLHLYVDGDADPATGREGPPNGGYTGCDYMVSMAGGSTSCGHFLPDHSRVNGPPVTYVVVGNAILMTADVDLGRDAEGIRYAIYVLSHNTTGGSGESPTMSDTINRKLVEGLRISTAAKITRPTDYADSHQMTRTFGLDIIRPLLVDKATLQIPHDRLEVDGFALDLFNTLRYPHIKMTRTGGRAWASPPKAGKYHVGFLTYDDGNTDRIVVRVNDEVAGVAVLNADNNRHWVYYLSEPREFSANDMVSFEAVGSGLHRISSMLFFPKAPETRAVEYKVADTEWIAPVGTEGAVSISWTTTWPSDTSFEYGRTTRYGLAASEECSRLVHKVRLEGLDPSATYHGRAVAKDRAGSPYYGPDITFSAKGNPAPQTQARTTDVPLVVRNPHTFDAVDWPVTGGVPFPRGVLGNAENVRVTLNGQEIAAQIKPTGTWPDGSIKWVLVTLLADVPAGGQTDYTLQFGRDISRSGGPAPMATLQGKGAVVDTGAARLTIDEHGQIAGFNCGQREVLTPGDTCLTSMTTSGRVTYSTGNAPAEVTLEENGPVRCIISTQGRMASADGAEGFIVQQRIEAYRGVPFIRINHRFINALPEEFTNTDEMVFSIPTASGQQWQAPVAEGEPLVLGGPTKTVHQRFDREYVTSGAGMDGVATGRVIGSLTCSTPEGCAIALRDFWQQYPKALSVTDNGVDIDLCPDFEAGLYDEFPFEKEGHQLYYYLLDGHYRLKTGMAKTHEMLLCGAESGARESTCALFQKPLLLTADPQWYCDSKAFYNVAPRNEQLFKAYEEGIDRNLAAYVAQRERQHDFGMMNYGDWYGERGANWGNIEYDTQHCFLLEYIRSGNPEAFYLGDVTEIHNRDVDTKQWSPREADIGLVYVHQMGHVGGFYTESVPGTLGIPKAGATVSHAWTEGHFDHYFLTGDPWSLQTGMAVADYFADKELSRPYNWGDCRVPGWHLIMNAAAQAATNDPYYLNVSRIIVRRVLETQDTEPRELPDYQKEPGRTHQVGGWSRMMVPGHCECEPRHRGNAGFMVAVLLTGLTYYYDVTEDPAVKEAIIRGAHYLMDECYNAEIHGFRYTSCPRTRYTPGASPLMVEGIARAYRWTRDERFLDPITQALAAGAGGSAYGKGFSMYYRCAPRLLDDLAACGLNLNERMVVKLAPFVPPDWMKALRDADKIVLQAEGFSAQGGGEVQVREDRQGIWGKMITYWHQDVGHWLEWKFTVPEDADYTVQFRYATSSPEPVRRFEIDGGVPDPVAQKVRFEPSGGFGALPSDWRFHPLRDAGGNDIVLPLKAGEHTIRMTNLGDGLGMDFIILMKRK